MGCSLKSKPCPGSCNGESDWQLHGGSSGIRRAAALAFAQKGARAVVASRRAHESGLLCECLLGRGPAPRAPEY